MFTDAAEFVESAEEDEESDRAWSSTSDIEAGSGLGCRGVPLRLCRNRSDMVAKARRVWAQLWEPVMVGSRSFDQEYFNSCSGGRRNAAASAGSELLYDMGSCNF